MGFHDTNSKTRLNIDEDDSSIRGWHIQRDWTKEEYSDPILGWIYVLGQIGVLLLDKCGIILDFMFITMDVVDILAQNQYSGRKVSVTDSNDHVNQTASIEALTYDYTVDATLSIVVDWVLDTQNDVSHSLTVYCTLEYFEYSIIDGSITDKSISTSVNLKICPDDNNSSDKAYPIQPGTYEMLYIGKYDVSDYYKINMYQGSLISVSAKAKSGDPTVFYLFLYNPNKALKTSSTYGNYESINYTIDCGGDWFIEVRTYGDCYGFYSLTVNVDYLPYTPSTPSGPVSGYVYTTYSYSTIATDPEGDNVRYEFNWDDGTSNTLTGWYASGTIATESHYWKRPGTYHIKVQARDMHEGRSNWSNTLTVSVSQNDAGSHADAGNSSSTATSLPYYGSHIGTLYQYNPTDTVDWYQFTAENGQEINVSMWPPSGVDFDLQLYDPSGALKAGSYKGAGYMDKVSCLANSTGNWKIRIYIYSGEGQYYSIVSVSPSGGGGGCPILYVYNGTEYISEGLLDIHNLDGVDVITNHTLISKPQPIYGTYLFQLVEHPKTISYIDQVKLYAILEDKTVIQLPLVWAWHSENGNVLRPLLFSDEWKTETKGADHNNGTSQSIQLKFLALPPCIKTIGFIFQIEGNNPYYK